MPAINTDYKNSFDNPEPYLARIAGAGFTHIHWCHEWSRDRLYTPDDMEHIASWLNTYSLLTNDLHASEGVKAPYYSADDIKRQAGLVLVKNRIDLAARLGSDVIVLHLPAQSRDGANPDEYEKIARRSLDELTPYALACGVKIALENLFPSNHELLERLLGDYSAESVGICYDSGHGNIVGDGLAFLDRVKARLIALHLNDNLGSRDQHLVPGQGSVDWTKLAALITASGYAKAVRTYELVIPKNTYANDHEFLVTAREAAESLESEIG